MNNSYSVYKHTNLVNGKIYIGITKGKPENRWNSGRGYVNSPHFYSAIQKYGWNSFDHEILKTGLTKEEACSVEQELIREFNTQDRNIGYNLSSGGQSGAAGIKQSEETKERKRVSDKRAWSNPDLRKKQSERLTGIHRSNETRRRMSEAAKNRSPITKDQKDKISKTLSKYFSDPENRKRASSVAIKYPVICVESGIVYSSSHEAFRATGVQQGNINACCRGARSKAGGFHWRFYKQQVDTEVTTETKESVAP